MFLTYNSVGKTNAFPTGVVENNGHQAVIVQHPKGQQWGAAIDGYPPVGERQSLDQAISEDERQEMLAIGATREQLIQSLYSEAFSPETLANMDFVVVYVGAAGSEGAIGLAARAGRQKARFVLCDCGLRAKVLTIAAECGEGAPFLQCECGGQATMEQLVREFLQTGTVGPLV